MEAFEFDSEKMADNRVILIFHSFKSIARVFRIIELCFGAFVLLWSSTRLPFAVRISGEYLRQLAAVILSPLFIFLVCNSIVLTLVLKSSAAAAGENSSGEPDLSSAGIVAGNSALRADESENIVYEDKETILEEEKKIEIALDSKKVPRRTKSEKCCRRIDDEISGKLRRSVTEKIESPANAVDELSNEEFQKAIEDFIAKQIKFHQEEKLAIVLHSQN